MAKNENDRNDFISSIKEEIRSELTAARLAVRKAHEACATAWKKVQAARKNLSTSKKKLKKLERSYQNVKSAPLEIANLQRRLKVIQQRIDELQELQNNPVTEADIKSAKAEIAMAEVGLLKALAEHKDAQWRLEQAKSNLEEVQLDTAAERRLWWEKWDGSIDDMLDD